MINLGFDKPSTIVVFGNETSGKYVEFVDTQSGKTLANKKFDNTALRN